MADQYVVMATLDRSLRHKGNGILHCGPGVGRCFPVGKGTQDGHQVLSTTEVILNDVKVHKKWRLGEEGQGFSIAMQTLDASRPMVGAMSVGIAQAAMNLPVIMPGQRGAVGVPIAGFQAIQFMLAIWP